ncbi:MAG: metallophosphoesterase [Pseudomonadota bacterium]
MLNGCSGTGHPTGIAEAAGRCDTGAVSGDAAAARLERLIRIALTAFAALTMLMATAAHAASPRIVAVGDLHGDYQAWLDIARDAGVLDPSGHWAGGKTTLVQLGDILDRGPDSLKIVRSLQQLQKEAASAGGRVIVVLGNHEAMNLLGDNRYTTPGEYAAFVDDRSPARRERLYMSIRQKLEAAAHLTNPRALPSEVRDQWLAQTPLGWIEHRLAWGASGELGKWAARNPAVVKVDGTLFAHGGLSAEYARLPIDEVNRRVAAAMAAGTDGPGSILNDPLGPLWYRGLVTRDPDALAERAAAKPPAPPLAAEQELDIVLKTYGAQRLVIGHTPSLKGIQITAGGRLARIDTGNSLYYGGPLSWLEIEGNRMTPHVVSRSAP